MLFSSAIPVIINGTAGRKTRFALALEKQIIQPPALNEDAYLTGDQIRQKVEDAFAREGVKIRTIMTERPGHAREIARELAHQGEPLIIAAGGDGTINEAANGLIGSGSALGIIPLGTANTFAIELGLPFTMEGVARMIKNRKSRVIDVGKVGNHYFVMGSGMSFDAHVIQRVHPVNKRLFGSLAYIFHGIWESLLYPFPRLKLECDELPAHNVEGYIVVVANARFYGGAFKAAPLAKLDDGLLDVLVLKKKHVWNLIYYIAAMKNGDIRDLPDIEYFQCRTLRITSRPGVPVHVDAEIREATPCTFECIPHALQVIVP